MFESKEMRWKTSENTIVEHEHFEANAREKGTRWYFTYKRVVENKVFDILTCESVYPLGYALLDLKVFKLSYWKGISG